MALSLNGTDVTVELAPDDGLFAASPTWVDITGYVRMVNTVSSGRTTEIDQSQPGTLEMVLDNRDRVFDLAYGPASVTFDGSGSDYWTCGDLAAFAGATELDVRACVSLDDWTPAASQTISAQQATTTNQRCWQFYIDTSGYLALRTSSNGTASTTTTSGCRVSAVDGQTVCVRATWVSSGDVYFYMKRTIKGRERADCVSHTGWLQLGTVKVGVTAALFNATSDVTIGDRLLTTEPLDGSVFYADARTTIGSSTLRFAFWPKDAATTAATSWVSSAGAGETWTKVGSSTVAIQGTYFGRMSPGTPVRVRAVRSATTYDVWYGYIRRTPQLYPYLGFDATVRVTGLDALGWLAEAVAPPWEDQMGQGDGSYWALREAVAELAVSDSQGQLGGRWSAVRTAGGITNPELPALQSSLLVNGVGLIARGTLDIDEADAVYGCRFHLANASSVFRILFRTPNGTTMGFNYGVDGSYCVQAPDAASAETYTNRFAVGSHTLRVYTTGGLFSDVYVDDVLVTLAGTTTAATVTVPMYLVGNDASVTDVFITTSAILARGATAGTRAEWVLNAANAGLIADITTDISTYLGAQQVGTNYADMLRQVNTAEQGRLYVSGDGKVTMRSRLWVLTDTAATASQATFGDGVSDVPYDGISIDPGSREDVINLVTVSLPDGTSATYKDQASVDEYGERNLSLSAPCAGLDDAVALAAYIAGLRARPRERVTNLTLTPGTNSTIWTQVLTRTHGDRVTVKRTPTATTSAINVPVCIERITHSITPDSWRTSLLTSPAPLTAQEAGYFTLDDTVLGVLDAGNVLVY